MMVEVFVHPHGPLFGGEAAKETMGMGGAALWTGCGKAVDHFA